MVSPSVCRNKFTNLITSQHSQAAKCLKEGDRGEESFWDF